MLCKIGLGNSPLTFDKSKEAGDRNQDSGNRTGSQGLRKRIVPPSPLRSASLIEAESGEPGAWRNQGRREKLLFVTGFTIADCGMKREKTSYRFEIQGAGGRQLDAKTIAIREGCFLSHCEKAIL